MTSDQPATTLKPKGSAEAILIAKRIINYDWIGYFNNETWINKDLVDNAMKEIVRILEADGTANADARRDAALEIIVRIIDILDECDRTVYAQQKWKVANAGLHGWLFKIQSDYPALAKNAPSGKKKASALGEVG